MNKDSGVHDKRQSSLHFGEYYADLYVRNLFAFAGCIVQSSSHAICLPAGAINWEQSTYSRAYHRCADCEEDGTAHAYQRRQIILSVV